MKDRVICPTCKTKNDGHPAFCASCGRRLKSREKAGAGRVATAPKPVGQDDRASSPMGETRLSRGSTDRPVEDAGHTVYLDADMLDLTRVRGRRGEGADPAAARDLPADKRRPSTPRRKPERTKEPIRRETDRPIDLGDTKVDFPRPGRKPRAPLGETMLSSPPAPPVVPPPPPEVPAPSSTDLENPPTLVCASCGSEYVGHEEGRFCPICGAATRAGELDDLEDDLEVVRKRPKAETMVWTPPTRDRARLLHVKPGGGVEHIDLAAEVSLVGRVQGSPRSLNFPLDEHLSPLHAEFRYAAGRLQVIDRGSLNGVYVRIGRSPPMRLQDGQNVCFGSQVFRFERMDPAGRGGAVIAEDGTKRFGSGRQRPLARLVSVLDDGTEGLAYEVGSDSCVFGREEGQYVFGTDRLMSVKHAQVYLRDGEFVIEDLNSSNGTFIRVEEKALEEGDELRMGMQKFRITYR